MVKPPNPTGDYNIDTLSNSPDKPPNPRPPPTPEAPEGSRQPRLRGARRDPQSASFLSLFIGFRGLGVSGFRGLGFRVFPWLLFVLFADFWFRLV